MRVFTCILYGSSFCSPRSEITVLCYGKCVSLGMLLLAEALEVPGNNTPLSLEKVSLNQKISTCSVPDCGAADCSYGKLGEIYLVQPHVLSKSNCRRRS